MYVCMYVVFRTPCATLAYASGVLSRLDILMSSLLLAV